MNNLAIFIGTFLVGLIGASIKGFEGFLIGIPIGLIGSVTLQLQQKVIAFEKRVAQLEAEATLDDTSSSSQTIKVTDEEPAPQIEPKASYSATTPEPEPSTSAQENAAWHSASENIGKKVAPIEISEKTPQAPSESNIFEKTSNYVKRYFTEGNFIVRVGVIVLFFGISFLVKYSIENSLVPIEVRLALTFLAGMVMLGGGWYLRNRNESYALIVQGGAIAINFLTIFASFKLYGLISAGFAFPLLILFSVLAMALAVLQNSRSLAVIGITGGFAAPIMASTGAGSHVALFSYYTVLNLAIFFTAWFKSWRLLNVIGFAFTFVIGTAWGVTQYAPEHFSSTEPFLVIFFLLYFAIAILFAHNQPPELKGYIDGTLIFGTPVIAFGLQSALVKDIEFGISISSMVLGIFYLVTARALWNNKNENYRLLCEALLAIGVIFATLTIPLALDGRWTAATWAIEGAGFVWVGLRQNRQLVKYFGLAIQFLGGSIFIFQYPYLIDPIPFLNSEFLGCLILAIAALFSSYQIEKHDENTDISKALSIAFAALGAIWWLTSGVSQIQQTLNAQLEINYQILFLAISTFTFLAINTKYQWKVSPALPWLPIIPALIFQTISIDKENPFSDYGFVTWPLLFLSIYSHLHVNRNQKGSIYYPEVLHIVFSLMLITLGYFQTTTFLQNLDLATIWQVSGGGLTLITALLLVDARFFWPSKLYERAYHQILVPIVLFSISVWAIKNNAFSLLKTEEIPYVPILNPIDIIQAIMLIITIKWFKKNKESFPFEFSPFQAWSVLGGILFAWFNVVLFKSIHLITGVSYTTIALFDSNVVQMSVSISWTIIGLTVMVFASKKDIRQLWFFGAGLTGVIVLKLFLVDLSGQGTIERIVSFLSVGALLLVVGYFSPIPPDQKQETINK